MNARTPRLLVVDDEPQILKAMKDLLEDEFEVIDCPSGESALRILKGGSSVSLIISDQRMPGMAGEQFLAQARELSDATRVLMTGYADLKAVISAVNDGQIFGYVSKPWDSAHLLLMVHRAVEHFQLSHQLSHERSLLNNLMDAVPDRIFFKDAAGRYLKANMPTAVGFGLSRPDALDGKTIEDLLPQSLAREVRQEDDLVLGSRRTLIDRVMKATSADGRPIWLSTTKAPIIDSKKQVVGLVGITRDITERKESELALLEIEQRYHTIYDKTPVMMCTTNRDGRILAANDFWCRFVGADRQLVIGRNITDFMSPDLRASFQVEILPTLQNEEIVSDVEGKFMGGGGRGIDALISIIREEDGREPAGQLIWVCVDLTEKKALERQLSHAQKMEAIGQLTGGIAHDFNNILGVIIGNLELLQDSVGSGGAGGREYVDGAMNASEKAANLIRQLLAFSRRQKLEPVDVDLGEMISSLLRMIERILGEQIIIKTMIGNSLWSVRADQAQLESALLNLCVNARDAMPHGGTLRIQAENTAIDVDYADRNLEVSPGEYVVVTVSDTGTGMSSEIIAKAFDPFFSTKDKGKGTGLGLSMVYGFIKQSGGHAAIYSELGHGTSVKLYFPRSQAAGTADGAEKQSASLSGGTETILLVEDDGDVRKTTAAALQKLGYKVFAVRNGQEAVQVLNDRSDIDLLFTDIIMPDGMNGIELARLALSQRPNMKVLYTSGYTDMDLRSERPLADKDNWLPKPYTRAVLADRIRGILDTPS